MSTVYYLLRGKKGRGEIAFFSVILITETISNRLLLWNFSSYDQGGGFP